MDPVGNGDSRNRFSSDPPRHQVCWYSRRTTHLPPELGLHTIEDGQLVYCAHPMWYPVVGYHFDVRNCENCDYYKPVRAALTGRNAVPQA